MRYRVVESKLKTNKSRKYLWSKINNPKKIIGIEGFAKNSTIKKISENNFEVISKKYHVLLTFIPQKAVNLTFIGVKNYPLTWFEIKGENNCTITHGEYKRMDSGMSKLKLKKEIEWVKKHFLEELKEISE
tara:strand:- start:332 stop:724 length:393 start_codon:yes stop_codon:yes gene_type:complete